MHAIVYYSCVCLFLRAFGEIYVYVRVRVRECVYPCQPLCVYDSNKCGEREVAAESDGSFVCCRLSLRGGTLLHPTREGQLRVIGSLVLGGELPPSHAFK